MLHQSITKSSRRYLILAVITISLILLSVFLFQPIRLPVNQPISPSPVTPLASTVTTTPTAPAPTSYPPKHLIKTTFIPQAPQKNWDQPWQDACEEAALLTVAFYYQNNRPSQNEIVSTILAMIDYQTVQGFSKDVNIDQMAQIATNYLHLKAEIISRPDLNRIKSYLAKDIPVIIPANGKQLFAENRHFNDGGPYYHSLVILGYDDRKEQFTVHDVGTRHGAYFKYSYDLLLDSIHDFPSSQRKEDINQGDKKALILLK